MLTGGGVSSVRRDTPPGGRTERPQIGRLRARPPPAVEQHRVRTRIVREAMPTTRRTVVEKPAPARAIVQPRFAEETRDGWIGAAMHDDRASARIVHHRDVIPRAGTRRVDASPGASVPLPRAGVRDRMRPAVFHDEATIDHQAIAGAVVREPVEPARGWTTRLAVGQELRPPRAIPLPQVVMLGTRSVARATEEHDAAAARIPGHGRGAARWWAVGRHALPVRPVPLPRVV